MSKFAKVVQTVQALQSLLSSTDKVYLEDVMEQHNLTAKSALSFLFNIYQGSGEKLAQLYDKQENYLDVTALEALVQQTKSQVKKDEKVAKALRLVRLLDSLNEATPSGGLTIKQLQSKCQVSERTLYRDLNALELEMGVSLVRPDPGQSQRGLYRLEGTYLKQLSPEQAILIYLSTLQQQGSVLAGQIDNIKGLLFNGLIANRFAVDKIEALQSKVHFVYETLSNSEAVAELFGQIISALLEQRPLKLNYYTASKGRYSDRIVHPYGLICKHSTWYLVAYCRQSDAVRTFRLDSIQRGIPLYLERFELPPDFSIQSYVGNAWGVVNEHKTTKVILEFDKTVAHRVKGTVYHPSQRIIKEKEDGSLQVEFQISGLLELQLWLLHWTTNVTVLEPEHLREEMRKLLKNMLTNYQN